MIDIKFLKLHIHHFLSFDDATIDLNDRGYCLIKGVNKNPKDAARSNGAGKSTIINAISFCLFGETLSGLRSNLPNNYFNDGCYVELSFDISNVSYQLLRSKDDTKYGTNLKILVDGKDKSGKGVRESEAILDGLLPDLTKELVTNVMLLGQGLPGKFTANTPSGRKEVLEHLSKSDFLIQDLKERIENRLTTLNLDIRSKQDLKLSLSTQKDMLNKSLQLAQEKLNKIDTTIDYNSLIVSKEQQLLDLKARYNKEEQRINGIQNQKLKLIESLNVVKQNKSDRLNRLSTQYLNDDKDLQIKISDKRSQAIQLEKQIKELQAITDICPTCGQKIPGAVKPNTSDKEALLATFYSAIKVLDQERISCKEGYEQNKHEIEAQTNPEIQEIEYKLNQLEGSTKNEYDINSLLSDIQTITSAINDLKKTKELAEIKMRELQAEISDIAENILNIDNNLTTCLFDLDILQKRVEIVNKMNTFAKRDFRGLLLENSINYINNKAQEYAAKIFNTSEIQFALCGNNIDISYCNKDYDNLSGGEKQRVDLITQFAIRDMLKTHLNFSSNILFLDEITDNLDEESCDRVINFITDELKDVESIFIISHHTDELNIPIDCEITVEKNIYGVSEVI